MARVEGDEIERLARMQHEVFRRVVYDGSLSPKKAFKALKELLGNRIVNVNGRGWDEMVKACGCDNVYIAPDFDPKKLPPLPADQQGETEAIMRKQDETTTNREWLQILDENKNGKNKFAHFLTVLALGESDPDEQRDNPYFTLVYDTDGQLWYLCLHVHDGMRYLHVRRDDLGYHWDGRCRAVSVAK